MHMHMHEHQTPPMEGEGGGGGSSTTGEAVGCVQKAVELGRVRWLRRLDKAKAESERTGKPILLLFQEVPGCGGCQTFGKVPLSNDALVRAMEELFVPVAIHNNTTLGHDAKVRRHYKEPSWAYPCLRFVDAKGADLVDRRDNMHQYTIQQLAAFMVNVLSIVGREIPPYLSAIVDGE